MSTTVDEHSEKRLRRPAAETRAHVLKVAHRLFSQVGFDALGVREIASAAAIDPAVLIRLFGSKSELFAAVVDHAFAEDPLFDGPIDSLPKRIAMLLTSASEDARDDDGDDLMLLLRSAASTIAGPIVSKALNAHLVEPLGRRLGDENAQLRAAMLISQIVGFATLRFALDAPALREARPKEVEARLAEMFEAVIR